ncbi:MlaD family protein [Patulibacter sp.]|uniref:MlaD family protein n=1 Tax=Patulibacter sp. TaxID=1912859 RepID=UPI0027224494|nr:MlaD family protein [Patulibacter sp.]MDO9409315.1 MlaD family protein [Patulibacter sp.]
MRRLVLDKPWAIIVAAALVAFGYWALQTRQQDHTVRAAFSSAVSVVPGLDVQIDGVDVGKVQKVQYQDGQALVDLGISDPDAWPLPRGTKAEIRFGTTIGNGTRNVALTPGPTNAPPIPEDGIITRADTTTPVEFDEVFNTLSAKTRSRLRAAMQGAEESTKNREDEIKAALRHAPGALDATNDVLADLLADGTALKALIRNGDRVTETLGQRQEIVSNLVSAASGTFDAFGRRTNRITQSLDRFAPMLKDVDGTLARANGSLDKVDTLMQTIRPGAQELPSLAKTAGPALVRLQDVAPTAVTTLKTVRNTAPRLSTLLDTATPFMKPTSEALSGLAPVVRCIRNYTPEIAAWTQTWGGFTKNYDNTSHYVRIKLKEGITSANGLVPPAEFLKNIPGTDNRYAMPRPPGLNAGSPWFDSECGVTKDALDPSKDPEKR